MYEYCRQLRLKCLCVTSDKNVYETSKTEHFKTVFALFTSFFHVFFFHTEQNRSVTERKHHFQFILSVFKCYLCSITL